jgi:hypothetical protein
MPSIPDSAKSTYLSVAVIVPDATRRRSLVTALAGAELTVVREFVDYPSQADLSELG